MPVNLKIKVTKEIIEKSMWCGFGSSNDIQENCAIALAVRDIFPDAQVEKYGIFLKREDWQTKGTDSDIQLPPEAIEFIGEFDLYSDTPEHRLLMPELEFEVEIPDKVLEEINIEELRPLLQNHPTLELV